MRMIALRERSSLVEHGLGKVNRIHALHPAREPTGKISCSAPNVENGLWLIGYQFQELGDGFVRVRRPIMIDLDDTRIFELFCILQAEMTWFWVHGSHSSLLSQTSEWTGSVF